MSATEMLFQPLTPVSSPRIAEPQPSLLDIDMIDPLISIETRNPRSRSSTPVKRIMSSYHSARECESRPSMNARHAQNHNPTQAARSWTRESAPSPTTSSAQEYNPHAPMMNNYSGTGPFGPHPRSNLGSGTSNENGVALSTIIPGNVFPPENMLNVAYSYGIRRPDGHITRLVPIDELNDGLVNPNIQSYQGPEGLILLPPPRQLSPDRRQGPEIMIPSRVIASLHTAHRPEVADYTQLQIDSIVHHNIVNTPPRRREKIYCDKWIHEGVCAFTQMGCKYKHEMPTDKATQMSLGLNHGFPSWYRRAFAVQSSQGSLSPSPVPTIASPTNARPLNTNWRRLEAPSGHHDSMHTASAGGRQFAQRSGNIRTSFGPIGPPPPQPNFGMPVDQNTFSTLKMEKTIEEDEDDDDTITWKGRHQQ